MLAQGTIIYWLCFSYFNLHHTVLMKEQTVLQILLIFSHKYLFWFTFYGWLWVPAFLSGSPKFGGTHFPVSLAGKESACNVGDLGLIPGLGRCPGERNSYPSSILAWKIPLTVESMESQRVGQDWVTFTFPCCGTAGNGLHILLF